MKNISVKKTILFACFCTLFLISCKKEIEKVSDTFKETVSGSDVSEIEKDSKKDSVPAVKKNPFRR